MKTITHDDISARIDGTTVTVDTPGLWPVEHPSWPELWSVTTLEDKLIVELTPPQGIGDDLLESHVEDEARLIVSAVREAFRDKTVRDRTL